MPGPASYALIGRSYVAIVDAQEHIMPNSLRRPTYDELVELSNGELMKRLRKVRDIVAQAWRERRAVPEAEQIYQDYEAERIKRLGIVKIRRRRS